ncbi:hypothetical protein B5V01_21740 [Mesorhizobium erdmanii]|uniref:Uncharacterized protein n=2 Tax=Mesorhizobium TaxID=68287 RepID=A0A3M9X1M0_9HYPH|nr:hypothetical protein DNR46_31950 [Mesorhizobium japonicum]RXT42856.1 hypothetical protein B5V01_21740 [Mesorhizobium erdmanii]
MKPKLNYAVTQNRSGGPYDTLGDDVISAFPIDEIDSSLISSLRREERERCEILSNSRSTRRCRFHLDHGVIFHIAGPVNQQIWFCSVGTKLGENWVRGFVDFACQAICRVVWPAASKLMREAIGTFSVKPPLPAARAKQ